LNWSFHDGEESGLGKENQLKHLVLVGDLVGSRRIAGRSAVQEKFKACLAQLNAKKREGLVSPYTITLGDEFQAVFSTPDRLFRDALTILLSLHPVSVRFSCAIGEISTAINTRQAIGMDGPAFHAARATIESMKKTESLFAITSSDGAGLAFINRSLALVSHAIRNWPVSRLKILHGLSENRSVEQIARDLRVTEQGVYKSIDAGAIWTIAPLLEEIVASLRQMMEPR
jgi:hypothetical protein